MAVDAGVEEEKFEKIWHAAETARTIGEITLEELIEKILKTNDCYSESAVDILNII